MALDRQPACASTCNFGKALQQVFTALVNCRATGLEANIRVGKYRLKVFYALRRVVQPTYIEYADRHLVADGVDLATGGLDTALVTKTDY